MEFLKAYPENLDADYLCKNFFDTLYNLSISGKLTHDGATYTLHDRELLNEHKFEIYEKILREDANNTFMVWGENEMIDSLLNDPLDIDTVSKNSALEPTKVTYILMAATLAHKFHYNNEKVKECIVAIQELIHSGVDKYAVYNLLLKKQREIRSWHANKSDADDLCLPFEKAYKYCKEIPSPYEPLIKKLKEIMNLRKSAKESYSIDAEYYFYQKAEVLENQVYEEAKKFDPFMLRRISYSMNAFELERQKLKQGYYGESTVCEDEPLFKFEETNLYKASKELALISTSLIHENKKEK